MRLFLALLLCCLPVVGQNATTFPRTANTAAEMASFPIPITQPVTRMTALLIGISSVSDQNGGLFYWDYQSTAVPDNFNYFLSTDPAYSVAGRWIRFPSEAPTPGQVATPVFSPVSGSFATSVDVSISTATAGASIYYTTDGSTPNSGSTLYTVPFTLVTTTTVKAIGIKAFLSDSTVATKTYTLAVPEQAVFWGYSPNTTLNAAEIQTLNYTVEPSFFRQYTFDASSTVNDYFYWWSPTVFSVPQPIIGFQDAITLFPIAMATSTEGFTDGPVNGWYFTLITVNGVSGRLFRSYNQLGGGGAFTSIVQ